MSFFGIRKTAQIPLQSMLIWYFFQMMRSFGQECMLLDTWVFYQFSDVPGNVLKRFHMKISNDLEKPAKLQIPCQEKIAQYIVFYSFPELTCTQTF